MEKHIPVTMTVNGERISRDVAVRQNLVDFLRYELGLTGSHVGCEHGVCGACTLKVDGSTVRGCLMLAAQADGAEIWTIEGLSQNGELEHLHEAFERHMALQCGFCTPGMLLTANELIERGKAKNREEVREYLSGNYCRCTGYQAIVDAVMDAAKAAGKR